MFKKICLFSGSILLILLLIECILRLYGAYYKYTLNQLYKHEKKDTTYKIKILAVGESTTAGLWVENQSYPIQLQAKLERYYNCQGCVEMNIMSLPGGNSSSTLYNLPKHLIKLKPNIVIFMEGYNDFAFYGYNIDALLLENFFTKNKIIYNAYLKYIDAINEIRIFRVAKLIYVSLTMPRTAYLDWNETVINHGAISGERAQFKNFRQTDIFIQRQISENIGKMVDIVRLNHITPILMTYHVARVNDIIRAVAKNKEVFLVDNEAVFKRLSNDYVFKDSPSHPNAKGYSIIADTIIEDLLKWGLVK